MFSQSTLNILAEDKSVVSYRPRFVALTDSTLAAILLQQMIYFWKSVSGRTFYKFKEPCEHEKYRAGDSWCESLEWNPYEFDTALKVIGTKITKGISKKTLLETKAPVRAEGESDQDFYKRMSEAVSRMVLYWTDRDHVTWYELNEVLISELLDAVYINELHGLRQIRKSILADRSRNSWVKRRLENSTDEGRFSSETTSEIPENTTKKKENNAHPAGGASSFPSKPDLSAVKKNLSAAKQKGTPTVEEEKTDPTAKPPQEALRAATPNPSTPGSASPPSPAVPPASTPPGEKRPRPKVPLTEAVAFAFKIEPGWTTTEIGQQLTGKVEKRGKRKEHQFAGAPDTPLRPMTAGEITAFGLWYAEHEKYGKQPGAPQTAETLKERVIEFRESSEYRRYMPMGENRLRKILGLEPRRVFAPAPEDLPPAMRLDPNAPPPANVMDEAELEQKMKAFTAKLTNHASMAKDRVYNG